MIAFHFSVDEGWLAVSSAALRRSPLILCPTGATAAVWEQRLVDAGLFRAGDIGAGLFACRDAYVLARTIEDDVARLADYYDRGEQHTDDFRDARDQLYHLPYAALARIDYQIRELAADAARDNMTWEGTATIDISRNAQETIDAAARRFEFRNTNCRSGCDNNCCPGEVRLYTFDDYEDNPIPLCLACFHQYLDASGEMGRRAKFHLRGRFLVVDQWEQADIFNPPVASPDAPAEPAPPSITAATSADLIAAYKGHGHT